MLFTHETNVIFVAPCFDKRALRLPVCSRLLIEWLKASYALFLGNRLRREVSELATDQIAAKLLFVHGWLGVWHLSFLGRITFRVGGTGTGASGMS
jgi:hypothetical protein